MKMQLLTATIAASLLCWSVQSAGQTLTINGVLPDPVLEDQPFQVPFDVANFCQTPQLTQVDFRTPSDPGPFNKMAPFDEGFAAAVVTNAGFENGLAPWGVVTTGRGTLLLSDNPERFPNGIPEGDSYGWVNINNGLLQNLDEIATPGTTYTLLTDVGKRQDLVGLGDYEINLLVGGVSVASATTPEPSNGEFLTSELVYTATAADEGLPLSIEIRVNEDPDDATRLQVNFDNIRLFASSTMDGGSEILDSRCCEAGNSYVTLLPPLDFFGDVAVEIFAEASCGMGFPDVASDSITFPVVPVNDPPVITLGAGIPETIMADGPGSVSFAPVDVLDPVEIDQGASYTVSVSPANLASTAAGTLVAGENLLLDYTGSLGTVNIEVTAVDTGLGPSDNGDENTTLESFAVQIVQAPNGRTVTIRSIVPEAPLEEQTFEVVHLIANFVAEPTLVPPVFTSDGVVVDGFTVVELPADGLGRLSITPPVDFFGEVSTRVVYSEPDPNPDFPDNTLFSQGGDVSLTIVGVNDPPVITPGDLPATILADGPGTVTITPVIELSAVEGQLVDYQLEVLPAGSGSIVEPGPFDAEDAVTLSYTGVPGELTITATATDDGGTDNGGNDTATTSFVVQIQQANVVIESIDPVEPLEEQSFTISYQLSNMPDTATLEPVEFFSNDFVVPGFTITGQQLVEGQGSFVVTPPVDFFGPATTVFRHSIPDPNNPGELVFSQGGGVDIDILPVNDAPVITLGSIPATILADGPGTVTLVPVSALSAVEDGQLVSYTLEVSPASRGTIVESGPFAAGQAVTLAYTGSLGTLGFFVDATDDGGFANGGTNSSSENFDIVINQATSERRVAINSVQPSPNLEDQDITVRFGVTGFAGTPTLDSVEVSQNESPLSGFRLVNSRCCGDGESVAVLRPPLNFSGTVDVVINVSEPNPNPDFDGDIFAEDSVSVDVLPVNDRPEITLGPAIDPLVVDEAGSVTLVPVVRLDAVEPDQAVSYIVSVEPADLASVSSSGPFAAGDEIELNYMRAAGEIVLTITATDNGGTANGGEDTAVDTYTVQVDLAPTTVEGLGSSRNSADGEGELITFSITNTGDASASEVVVSVEGGAFVIEGGRTVLGGCVTDIDANGNIFVSCDQPDPASDWDCEPPSNAGANLVCRLRTVLAPGASSDLLISGSGAGVITATVVADNVSDPVIITVDTDG